MAYIGTLENSTLALLKQVLTHFRLEGRFVRAHQIKTGYINQTYCVEIEVSEERIKKYTLQRINTEVFTDVDSLMDNFENITEYLSNRLHLEGSANGRSIQTLTLTKNGGPYYQDETGCWRLLSHFTGVYSMDIPKNASVFYHAGKAFGTFSRQLTGFPVERVHTVIPNFHNTPLRFRALEEAIARDPVGRAKDVAPEIAFLRAREQRLGLIAGALERGEIPLRICHNDCNLNNILFDIDSDLPVAVIDLDTVMPGTVLYDFGDSMRVGTNTAVDDEKDLSKVHCDLNLYQRYAQGYLEAIGNILTEKELELLPYAAPIITSEDGIRFLADYINGDTYYTISYPEQNLDRARTQLALLNDMEQKMPEINAILGRIYQESGFKRA